MQEKEGIMQLAQFHDDGRMDHTTSDCRWQILPVDTDIHATREFSLFYLIAMLACRECPPAVESSPFYTTPLSYMYKPGHRLTRC